MMRVMLRALLPVTALVLCLFAPGLARAQVSEVLITGSLIASAYEAPYVTLPRRADNMIRNIRVICDTRDPDQRREELVGTLRGLIDAAESDPTIELGVSDDDIVSDFDESMFGAVISPDTRADTSFAILTVKTALTAADTHETASARITAFIDNATLVGRSLITNTDDWNLTLVGPELSRDALLQMIASESSRTAAMFGPAYEVEVMGLQYPVKWFRSGLLDLTLFIPYELRISSIP